MIKLCYLNRIFSKSLTFLVAIHLVSCSTNNDVSGLISSMTLEEKIGQMTQVDYRYLQDVTDINKYFLGSILSGGGSTPPTNQPSSWVDLYNRFQEQALKTRLKIPLIYGIDAVHGHNNVVGATIFPHNIGLGCANDEKLIKEIAVATAVEIQATGLDWTFSPCLAVAQDERWGRTYESFSEDSDIVTKLGVATVQGYQMGNSLSKKSVLACAKHYVGDGNTVFGTGGNNYKIDRGDVVLDESELRSKYIKPFKESIKQGVGSIMISYNSWRGKKLHGHKYLINDILKQELGFKGFVVSDWAGINEIDKDYKASIIKSINAGIDMVMVPGSLNPDHDSYDDFIRLAIESVKEGSIPMNRIDDAVTRILKIKKKIGLFDGPIKKPQNTNMVGSKKHRELARESVRKSVVLLKNENKLLPIGKSGKKITFVGEHADNIGYQCGGWTITWQGGSGDITPGTSILDAFKATIRDTNDISYSIDGVNIPDTDIIIAVIGEKPYSEGWGDRKSLDLSKENKKILKRVKEKNLPYLIILVSGRPMLIEDEIKDCDAFIAVWLPGTEGAGIADVIFGDHAPTGKLSMSWPRSMDQLPINIGDKIYNPLFPFGYGLSY
ncbi:MAG: glycoside hydrolase family 3 N-terminal domain-containing protein [Candidatus Neomarinimicrobiota bacterium]|nr:glycoside hydrolase family 3 N-terminal domain-containing protein [Candidatus Neomarinimicrobiota bacterium]